MPGRLQRQRPDINPGARGRRRHRQRLRRHRQRLPRTTTATATTTTVDCDDNNPTINPGASELLRRRRQRLRRLQRLRAGRRRRRLRNDPATATTTTRPSTPGARTAATASTTTATARCPSTTTAMAGRHGRLQRRRPRHLPGRLRRLRRHRQRLRRHRQRLPDGLRPGRPDLLHTSVGCVYYAVDANNDPIEGYECPAPDAVAVSNVDPTNSAKGVLKVQHGEIGSTVWDFTIQSRRDGRRGRGTLHQFSLPDQRQRQLHQLPNLVVIAW